MVRSSGKVMLTAAVAASLMSVSVSAMQDRPIPDETLGLSETSVFGIPDPGVFEYGKADPGAVGKRVSRSYHTAPPMIPHTVQDMLPIRQDFNLCKDCHVQPDLIGKKLIQGMPVPVPVSHYVDVKKGELYLGRWNCVQCHAPQAKVETLVVNTFKKPR